MCIAASGSLPLIGVSYQIAAKDERYLQEVMMFPSRNAAISEIMKTSEIFRIIGINCLAGGRIPPFQAFEYLKGKVYDFMVGIASFLELLTAFDAAKSTG